MSDFKYTDGRSLPLNLALWLADDTYDHSSNPMSISATTLIKSTRYIVGTLWKQAGKLDSKDYVSGSLFELIPSSFGTAVHEAVDKAWSMEPEKKAKLLAQIGYNDIEIKTMQVIHEERFEKAFDEFTITGKVDFIINGALHDVKTTSVFSYMLGSNDDKYILQGSIYRWLNPDVITEDYLTIDFVFTDWSKRSVGTKDYPEKRIMSKRFQLLPLEAVERIISEKVSEVRKYINANTLDEVPCCDPEQVYGKSSYKVFKDKAAFDEGKRCTRKFDNIFDANSYAATLPNAYVHEEKGTPFPCMYCRKDYGIN